VHHLQTQMALFASGRPFHGTRSQNCSPAPLQDQGPIVLAAVRACPAQVHHVPLYARKPPRRLLVQELEQQTELLVVPMHQRCELMFLAVAPLACPEESAKMAVWLLLVLEVLVQLMFGHAVPVVASPYHESLPEPAAEPHSEHASESAMPWAN